MAVVNSLGINLLRAVLANNDTKLFSKLKRELFVENELPLYEFVTHHSLKYGQFPTLGDCEAAGLLPQIMVGNMGSAQYYLDEVKNRTKFSIGQKAVPDLIELLKKQDINGIQAYFKEASLKIAAVNAQESLTTFNDNAALIYEKLINNNTTLLDNAVMFGYPFMDQATGGMVGGDLVVDIGRPGMGKSYVLMNKAKHAWKEQGKSVLFVSMEMAAESMSKRMLATLAGVNPKALRTGEICYFSKDLLNIAVAEIQGMPPFYMIDGAFSSSVPSIDAAIVDLKPDVVYIDASYLLTGSQGNKARRSTWEFVEDIQKELKQVASSHNIPINHTVQFNRETETTKTPSLKNIAGGDTIGQISSIASGIFKGNPPYESVRRKYSLLKNREGEGEQYAEINFLFSPPQFDEINEEDKATQKAVVSSEWML